ncbi:MAG: phosphoribosylglycinamide formyltransferase [Planctomycetota bacterium]|nr:phosphoribosylglycinamide formyltransferase [Planctomycetota bacterium]
MGASVAKLRLAVLLSGSGTTLENFFELSEKGELPAEVVLVVGSRPDAFGLERARKRNVPTAVVERKKFVLPEEFSEAIFKTVEPVKPDVICLAGFLSLLKIPPAYEHRVVNIHPALLPSFGGKGYYGNKVHEAVLKAGCKVAGCTVHFVDNEYDHGPIIAQRAVPVLEGDTTERLAARVQEAERAVYPEVLKLLAQGRVKVEGRAVKVLPA